MTNAEKCKQWRKMRLAQDPDYDRKAQLWQRYRITLAEIESMKRKQKSACAICKRTKVELVVDHDHTTGRVRGLLCNGCNRLLGLACDSPRHLKQAIRYLKKDAP